MLRKKHLLLMLAMAGMAGTTKAQQHCGTDEMHRNYIKARPEIAEYEKQLNEAISTNLSHMDLSKFARTTSDVDVFYDIPVVVHVMHNYGTELVADDDIYRMISDMNDVYMLRNDTSTVIEPFKKYVGKAKIRFHLATKDPNGNATKGITHRFTYLTYGGDDQAKMDQWPPNSYYNIWLENVIGRGTSAGTVLAYSTFPSSAAIFPFYDGVMAAAPYIHTTNTIEHETGHYLNLLHPWNSSNADVGSACGDDQVDDTPPTTGSFTCNLWDTTCAHNYFKVYPSITGADSMVNYPDTVNKQNIMDYATCPNMFTKGQVYRMQQTLNNPMAGRNNLSSAANLAATGALAPMPDLPPVADFTVRTTSAATAPFSYFALPGTNVTFFNKSWNDTVTDVKWTFGGGASVANSSSKTNVTLNFSVGGWAPITMAVTGNNSGTTTQTFDKSVFVADPVATAAPGYFQDFSPSGDVAKWPTFNYYGNEFKWEMSSNGLYDGYAMKYNGYDSRIMSSGGVTVYPFTGTPRGDYDDMFSAPMDLTAYSSACNLNFWYSGATRSSASSEINDTLYIDYSANKSATWTNVAKITKGQLANRGSHTEAFVPSGPSDWSPKTINLPAGARTAYTVFRFRYKPGVSASGSLVSTGNNFYIDRINFSPFPAEASNLAAANAAIAVVPNPTQGGAYVMVKDAENGTAHVTVTDITGKVVYTTDQHITNKQASIEIPQSAVAVKGIYLVQTTTGTQVNTQKLVVY